MPSWHGCCPSRWPVPTSCGHKPRPGPGSRAWTEAAQATIRETVAAGLDLVVPTSAPPAALPDGPVRLTAEVYDPAGHYLGELLLWVKDGRLTSLEYAWVTDVAPTALPAVEAIRVTA